MEVMHYIYRSGFKSFDCKVKVLAVSLINWPFLIKKRQELEFLIAISYFDWLLIEHKIDNRFKTPGVLNLNLNLRSNDEKKDIH